MSRRKKATWQTACLSQTPLTVGICGLPNEVLVKILIHVFEYEQNETLCAPTRNLAFVCKLFKEVSNQHPTLQGFLCGKSHYVPPQRCQRYFSRTFSPQHKVAGAFFDHMICATESGTLQLTLYTELPNGASAPVHCIDFPNVVRKGTSIETVTSMPFMINPTSKVLKILVAFTTRRAGCSKTSIGAGFIEFEGSSPDSKVAKDPELVYTKISIDNEVTRLDGLIPSLHANHACNSNHENFSDKILPEIILRQYRKNATVTIVLRIETNENSVYAPKYRLKAKADHHQRLDCDEEHVPFQEIGTYHSYNSPLVNPTVFLGTRTFKSSVSSNSRIPVNFEPDPGCTSSIYSTYAGLDLGTASSKVAKIHCSLPDGLVFVLSRCGQLSFQCMHWSPYGYGLSKFTPPRIVLPSGTVKDIAGDQYQAGLFLLTKDNRFMYLDLPSLQHQQGADWRIPKHVPQHLVTSAKATDYHQRVALMLQDFSNSIPPHSKVLQVRVSGRCLSLMTREEETNGSGKIQIYVAQYDKKIIFSKRLDSSPENHPCSPTTNITLDQLVEKISAVQSEKNKS